MDYMELIEKDIAKDNEKLNACCQELYSKYSDAFDLMFEYMKGIKDRDVFSLAIYDLLKEYAGDKQYDLKTKAPSSIMTIRKNIGDPCEIRVERKTNSWTINIYFIGANESVGSGICKKFNKDFKPGKTEQKLHGVTFLDTRYVNKVETEELTAEDIKGEKKDRLTECLDAIFSKLDK